MFEEIVEANLMVHNSGEFPRRKYRVDCPYCVEHGKKADDGGHFSLFIDNWWGSCHRCGHKAHARDVLTKYGVVNLPRESVDEAMKRLVEQVKGITSTAVEEVVPEDAPEIALPSGNWMNFAPEKMDRSYYRPALSELHRWKMTPSMAFAAGWLWDVGKKSFLFPVYIGGKLVFWQTRAIGGFRGGPSGNFEKYGILGNWENPLREVVDTVYVVEGPKDSTVMAAKGLWAVHLHSHHISKWQAARLKALRHRVVVLFDADVAASSMKMENSGWEVAYLPRDDPSKIGDNLQEVVENSFGLSAKVEQIVRAKQVESLASKKPFIRR